MKPTIWLKIAGLFLIIEGAGSILASEFEEPIWHLGRVIRIIIGAGLLLYKGK